MFLFTFHIFVLYVHAFLNFFLLSLYYNFHFIFSFFYSWYSLFSLLSFKGPYKAISDSTKVPNVSQQSKVSVCLCVCEFVNFALIEILTHLKTECTSFSTLITKLKFLVVFAHTCTNTIAVL